MNRPNPDAFQAENWPCASAGWLFFGEGMGTWPVGSPKRPWELFAFLMANAQSAPVPALLFEPRALRRFTASEPAADTPPAHLISRSSFVTSGL